MQEDDAQGHMAQGLSTVPTRMQITRDSRGIITEINMAESIPVGDKHVMGRRQGRAEEHLAVEQRLSLHPEMTVLLGKNGSGKSSLINALSTLYSLPGQAHEAYWLADLPAGSTGYPVTVKIDPAMFIPQEALRLRASHARSTPGVTNLFIQPQIVLDEHRKTMAIHTARMRMEDLWPVDSEIFQAITADREMLDRISARLQEITSAAVHAQATSIEVPEEKTFHMAYGVRGAGGEPGENRFVGYSLLSHGMRQALTICTMIELEQRLPLQGDFKPILMFDEPSEGLQPKARQRLHEMLLRLSRERQIIIATHEMELIPDDDRMIRITKRRGHSTISVTKPDWSSDQVELTPVMKARKLDLVDNILRHKIALLVEGSSDEDFIRTVLESPSYQGPQLSRRLQMVAVKGTNGILDMAKMLRARSADEVVHHDFIVMMDTDANPQPRKAVSTLIAPDQPVMIGNYGRLSAQCACDDLANMPDQDRAEELRQRRHNDPNGEVRCKLGEIEDLLEPEEYLCLFNQAMDLAQPLVAPSDLRIPITKWIEARLNGHAEAGDLPGCKVHPRKGNPGRWEFHGEVGRWFSENPASVQLSEATLERFGQLVATLNDRARFIESNVLPYP